MKQPAKRTLRVDVDETGWTSGPLCSPERVH